MKVTKEDLIQFLAKHGAELDLSINGIQFVGLETVLVGINQQMVARTAVMQDATAILNEHTDAEEAMFDYFCDGAFDSAFDRAFFNR